MSSTMNFCGTSQSTERSNNMDAKKCDRCGKLYNRYDAVPNLQVQKYIHGFGDVRLDLCPECQRKLEIFCNYVEDK